MMINQHVQHRRRRRVPNWRLTQHNNFTVHRIPLCVATFATLAISSKWIDLLGSLLVVNSWNGSQICYQSRFYTKRSFHRLVHGFDGSWNIVNKSSFRCHETIPSYTCNSNTIRFIQGFRNGQVMHFYSPPSNGDHEESWELGDEEEEREDSDVDESYILNLENSSDDDDYDNQIDTIITDIDHDDTTAANNLRVEYERWLAAVNKAVSALETKQFSLQKEFGKAEQLESLQSRGQYLQSYRHMFTNQVQSVTVQDWDTGEDIILTLDPSYDSIGDEINSIFTETKKLKRGKKVVGKLLEQTSAALESMREMKNDLDGVLFPSTETTASSQINSNLLKFIQHRLVDSSQVTNFRPPKDVANNNGSKEGGTSTPEKRKSLTDSKPVLGSPSSNIRKITSPAGCTILVGRNRRGNEYLSLNLAKKDDIWMHARDIPGAHVLVVQRRGGVYATDDCFQLAADLAAFYSDGRTERKVLVSAAEPKHIQKPRGAPLGAVKVREELRVYNGRPDAVPVELKEARAVSGLSDEYRIKDKSKLRKLNKQQLAEKRQDSKRKMQEQTDKRNKEEADKFY